MNNLEALLHEQPWLSQVQCKTSPPHIFFTGQKSDCLKAKKICNACPVKQECLDWSIANHMQYGIWGGRTPKERIEYALNNDMLDTCPQGHDLKDPSNIRYDSGHWRCLGCRREYYHNHEKERLAARRRGLDV